MRKVVMARWGDNPSSDSDGGEKKKDKLGTKETGQDRDMEGSQVEDLLGGQEGRFFEKFRCIFNKN